MNITKSNIVGKIVADDFRTASVFKSHNIDFCCKGNRSVEEACANKEIDVEQLLIELNDLQNHTEKSVNNFNTWDLDLLIDYIEKKHHRYVVSRLPEIKLFLNKVVKVHGGRHPELEKVENLFVESAINLMDHMKKEENILFPQVRKLLGDSLTSDSTTGTVKNPIEVMMQEHQSEGDRFAEITELTNNYTPPADACVTYKVAYAMLDEFENDLHQHIHLENNILFPKAIELEKKRMKEQLLHIQ